MQEINKIETGKRIRELREAAAETQADLAGLLEVKRQIISYYESGTRIPTLEHLIFFADHYNTTTDYLLCLSNVPTTDKDIKFICDYTGLNEKVIQKKFNNKTQKRGLGLADIINIICNKLEGEVILSAIVSYMNEFKRSSTELFEILTSVHNTDNDEHEQHLYDIAETKIQEKDLAQFRAEREFRGIFRLLIEDEKRRINDTFSAYTIKDEFDITDLEGANNANNP